MSADLLRRAAAKIRENAEAASSGPWKVVSSVRHGQTFVLDPESTDVCLTNRADDPDATHIASWHPTIAFAVAKWLDDVASGWMWDDVDEDGYGGVDDLDGFPLKFEESMDTHPVAIARAYLGEDA